MSAAFQIRLSEAAETLPVLFGRDGDFEGAPDWRCNLFHDGGYVPFFSFRVDGEFTFFSAGSTSICSRSRSEELLEGYALDLRIPSVATRVAALCARALEADPRRRGSNRDVSEWHSEWARVVALYGRTIRGWSAEDAETLAALFLALAPRIAAPGGSDVR